MPDREPRYDVEPGTDGSWLVVDRGLDRAGRRAIGRFDSAPAAHRDAATLSELEDITTERDSAPPGAEWRVADVIANITAAIDEEHNYDHLLRRHSP